MICLHCLHAKTTVTNSRRHKQRPSVWRRRQCSRCQTTITTYEAPSLDEQPVLTRSAGLQPFNLGKLIISISRSFQHDTATGETASYYLAQTIQQQLLLQAPQPSTDDILAITYAALQRYDALAAVQYAAQHDILTTRRRGRPLTGASVPPLPEHSSEQWPSL